MFHLQKSNLIGVKIVEITKNKQLNWAKEI